MSYLNVLLLQFFEVFNWRVKLEWISSFSASLIISFLVSDSPSAFLPSSGPSPACLKLILPCFLDVRLLVAKLDDDLAERFEVAAAWTVALRFEGGPDEGDAGGVEFRFEAGSPVALVGDEGLAGPVEIAEGDHVQGGVAFVGLGSRGVSPS